MFLSFISSPFITWEIVYLYMLFFFFFFFIFYFFFFISFFFYELIRNLLTRSMSGVVGSLSWGIVATRICTVDLS